MKTIKFTALSDKLIADWDAIWKNSANANMVNSSTWTIAAQTAFHKKNVCIIAVYDDQEKNLVAIAAFVKENLYGIPFWTQPGREFADKTSILIDFKDLETVDLLFSEIKKLGTSYLTEYTQDQIQEIQQSVPAITAWKSDVNPYIDFSQGKYGELPNRRRNTFLRRLEETNVHADLVTSADDTSRKALEVCFQIDMASLKQKKGKGIFYREEVREFYKALIVRSPENVPVSVLYLENKPISYLIGFQVKGVYQASQKAFLPGFEFYNPGKLLMIKFIDSFDPNSLPAIELGRGYDRFKLHFTKSYYELYDLIITQNKATAIYITTLLTLKKKAYEAINKHAKLYQFYTRLRDTLKPFKK